MQVGAIEIEIAIGIEIEIVFTARSRSRSRSRRRGRDPRPAAVPAELDQPPSDLPAGVAGTLIDQQADVQDVLATLRLELGGRYPKTRFPLAAELFERLMTAETCPEWLTVVAYDHID